MNTDIRKITDNPNVRKVVGSLAIIGTAAAVAGMGTFGSFTDSTTPVDTTIQSGTLSINANQTGYSVPVTTAGFVPGDSLTRAVNLVNDGSAPLVSINSGTTQTLANGPVVQSVTLANPAALNAGGTDHLVFSISLPTSADNTFQGKTASLSLSFTGVQRSGTAR
jgi:predicted ribosomally synthesized peptide with SipW-like signal peptide